MHAIVKNFTLSSLILGGFLLVSSCLVHAEDSVLSVDKDGSVRVRADDGTVRSFAPRFFILSQSFDPKFELRYPDFQDPRMKKMYNVASWAKKPETNVAPVPVSNQHVADGFDPSMDQAATDRCFDIFQTAPGVPAVASHAEMKDGRVAWSFPESDLFTLTASVEMTPGAKEPLLTFQFTPKKALWFSVGYTGAPETAPTAMDEMWQPLIWQEKRFPNQAYLTESGRCPLPGTLVRQGGITTGVIADPSELPFMPMPTVGNSGFGVAVRNAAGAAQSTIFAPLLGGVGSQMEAGKTYTFKVRLVVNHGSISDTYEKLATGLYQFHDYRHNNGMGSLNRTLERMTDYAMSKWARFNEDLRGCAYDTDVPGSVKNVSSLHPLAMALVMDDPAIFDRRARPMIEYSMSREKFLFSPNPAVKGQGVSSNLTGPCAQLSELTALYEISRKQTPLFLSSAKDLLGTTRTLNLNEPVRGDIWQNELALYDATGDKSWLEKATSHADEYLQQRFDTEQTDFSDKASRGMFFWTSYAPNWIDLFRLYKTTGQKKYLDAANEGARRFAEFIWMCPVIPQGNVDVNPDGLAPIYRHSDKYPQMKVPPETVPAWRLSEIGLTPEASGTSKGHRAIFPAAFAAWMLELSQATGDVFLHDIARSAIIGRYMSFPGYHMNTARTTAYEKADFPDRTIEELDATTSLHYNHIWPHIALLLDYLVSDTYARTKGAISFPSHYAEGYAYLQSKIYGDRPGKFYGQDAWLWMPKGLLTFDNPEINYIAARSADTVYIALANQSDQPVKATLCLNKDLVAYTPGQRYEVQVWKENQAGASEQAEPSAIQVTIAPKGITALAIHGIKPNIKFQQDFQNSDDVWKTDKTTVAYGGTHAMIFNFGPGLQWAYVYLQAKSDTVAQATLNYSTGGEWKTMTDSSFPFEFSVPLTNDVHQFSFKIEETGVDGKKTESETGKLVR